MAHRRRSSTGPTLLPTDPYASAKLAGLRYVSDASPGYTRQRRGKGFAILDAEGRPVRDREVQQRVRSLVIPPAWTRVWICAQPHGHLQAIGFDARGRKQYRYHPLYRQMRDTTKYTRMLAFGLALPKIRARVEQDLKSPGIPKHKVLAAIVRLLETTCIRVGNEEYKKQNESFGLTTLQDEHVEIEGSKMRFRFKGKSGQAHDVELSDRRLARIVRECQEIPGNELFQYIDENGDNGRIGSEDVNAYLQEAAGDAFTAKDFRTWNGTREAALALHQLGPAMTKTEAKKKLVAAVKSTAERLNNRPATCKKYYIHPAIMEAYESGALFDILPKAQHQPEAYGLQAEEVAVMQLLEAYTPPTPKAQPKVAAEVTERRKAARRVIDRAVRAAKRVRAS